MVLTLVLTLFSWDLDKVALYSNKATPNYQKPMKSMFDPRIGFNPISIPYIDDKEDEDEDDKDKENQTHYPLGFYRMTAYEWLT